MLGQQPDVKSKSAVMPTDEAIGQNLGRYKLLEKIGEGGCGVVYVAEQTEPVRRRVALKVIKLGMDTREVIARFETERQALALMDHPNIARVLDAGATETGRPFFVMELASGLRITDYCERHQLSIRQRLGLFMSVCHAVQHAHQKGIVHRDLKPSNILVVEHEGGAVPKVIDFGIAIATGQGFETNSGLTSVNQFMGTPAYMSPEQVEFGTRDIDTRTDIYSLGVILYELLTGQPPFEPQELAHAGLDEMRRVIREVNPPRPSARLASNLNPNRLPSRADPARERLAAVRGDLDWIAMKCLEKDRTRRYETANGLALELKRHLNHEPVLARPPSAFYRLQKAIHRHQLAFGASLAVAAALLIGTSASLWQAARAKSSELLARRIAYSSDMNLAQQALAMNNLGRAQSLLQRQRPHSGQADLRDWEWRYLWSQTRPDEHQVFWRGTNLLGAISFSADGRFLALEIENRILVSDIAFRNRILEHEGGRSPTFANHSPMLAFAQSESATNDVIVLWDMANHREQRRLPQTGQVLTLSFTPDDQRLLVIAEQPTTQAIYAPTYNARHLISAWNFATGKRLWQQPDRSPEEATSPTLAVSPDGSLFAVAIANGSFCVRETADGRERRTVKATPEFVTALAFAPDGNTIVSGAGYTDAAIQLWDVHTGAHRGTLEGHRSWVSSLAFTRDGRQLISASADQTIRRWDWSARAAAGVLRGHVYTVNEVVPSPDGRTLASNTREGEVFLWELDKPSSHPNVRRLRATLASAVFTADSKAILGAERGGGLALWNLQTFAELKRWRENSPTNSTFMKLAPDAGSTALFEQGGNVSLWNLRTDARTAISTASGEHILDCLFTRNGNYLVTFVQMPTNVVARIWDVRQARPAGTFSLEMARVFAAPEIADSILVAGAGGLRLWNVEKPGAPPRFISEHGDFAGFEATPDHRLGAGAFTEGYVRLWNMATLQPVDTLRGLLLGAHSVAFSLDGKRLAAGSNGQEAIKLWDVETRQEVLTLVGEGSLFERAVFSPDGRHLMAINAAGTLHLWSAPSWEEIAAAEAKEKAETKQP
jgi:serine/threonine protein kinase/WD40 repeat protein